ncbi:MAG: LTA synthase family protein [Acidobacteria bacterium]|nr:LTA synthase family protein [Acidobacteriota bacterium]
MLKKLSQCIGLASIILVMQYGDLLGGGSDVRMHVPFALGGIVFAQLADIFLLGLLLFAVLAPLSRTRLYPALRLLLAIAIPPYLIQRIRPAIPFPLSNAALLIVSIVWAAFVIALFARSYRSYQRLLRLGDFVGTFFAIFAFCTVIQLLYTTRWTPGPHQRTATWATTTQLPRQHSLVVWIVFDELSFDQIYEHRYPGLNLPNFDALRNQSTLFTNAQPIGDRTVKVIPSLLGGRIISHYRFTFDNQLKVRYADTPGVHPFAGPQTIFADAQTQGWRTAAVGWYNPYCTIYASAIDDCYWMNLDKFDAPMAQDATAANNILLPLKVTAEELVQPSKARDFLCTFDVRQRYKTYIDLEQYTAQLLKNDQADFVFLHLPIPHSPNIWDRKTNSFTRKCGSSYVDNLALTDRELGKIMRTLQSSPRWKDTTLIVEGDHSWRTYLWENQPSWTDEDEVASHDDFDPRPAMIIHQAGQTTPQINATAWSILNLHTVLEHIIHGQTIHL